MSDRMEDNNSTTAAGHVPGLQRRFDREGGKAPYVRRMFGGIAGVYDRMNRLMTAGLDRRWRAFAAHQLALGAGALGLDVGTGTADLAIAAIRAAGPDTHMIGIDFVPEMLAIGRQKIERLGLADQIELRSGDGQHLSFPDETFDGVCSAFVARNLSDLSGGLREQWRVLKPGGRMVCLEITHPPGPFFGALFHLYFDRLVPLMGKAIGRSFESYSYLHQSLAAFPRAPQLKALMEQAGFANVHYTYLTLGAVAVHIGTRPHA
jgi:demethylmenaquinone methyltransferase/2-methoxy-6-polyprenyl-1,4-benzoquinol methylase